MISLLFSFSVQYPFKFLISTLNIYLLIVRISYHVQCMHEYTLEYFKEAVEKRMTILKQSKLPVCTLPLLILYANQ